MKSSMLFLVVTALLFSVAVLPPPCHGGAVEPLDCYSDCMDKCPGRTQACSAQCNIECDPDSLVKKIGKYGVGSKK
ncbi:unnamed protein product [Linum trigynum]|uniref:Uncharacterized protein n=1 Tax=Linum trigynum TaxID=586398 RepID=A0AAV2EZY0_9ROSI